MLPNDERREPLFVVGEGVNVLTKGLPYLAGYITRIEGNDIFIKFPFGRFDKYEYKYQVDSILPFTTQFLNGKFTVIKIIKSRPLACQKRKIKDYEERLQEYFNTRCDGVMVIYANIVKYYKRFF